MLTCSGAVPISPRTRTARPCKGLLLICRVQTYPKPVDALHVAKGTCGQA